MSLIALRPEQVLDIHARLTREWRQPTALLTGYLLNFMQGAQEHDGGGAAMSMFYPVIPQGILPSQVTAGHADAMCRHIGFDLSEAVTYQVTAEMTGIMRAVHDRSVKDILRVEEAEMPCEAGFAYLDDGWPMLDRAGEVYMIRAVSWRYLTARGEPGEMKRFGREPADGWACARFALWVHPDDDPPEIRTVSSLVSRQNISAIHASIIPFGVDIKKGTDDKGESFLSLINLLWMFIQMEITAESRPRIKNHYRKQAMKSLKHGEVRVILLRRIRHVTETTDHQPVDWSCRWVVQGHYRHTVHPDDGHRAIAAGADKHCTRCGDQLHWVAPYLKGPDGKPIKVSHSIMKLAR